MTTDHTFLVLMGYATAAVLALGVYLLNRWDERSRRSSCNKSTAASGSR